MFQIFQDNSCLFYYSLKELKEINSRLKEMSISLNENAAQQLPPDRLSHSSINVSVGIDPHVAARIAECITNYRKITEIERPQYLFNSVVSEHPLAQQWQQQRSGAGDGGKGSGVRDGGAGGDNLNSRLNIMGDGEITSNREKEEYRMGNGGRYGDKEAAGDNNIENTSDNKSGFSDLDSAKNFSPGRPPISRNRRCQSATERLGAYYSRGLYGGVGEAGGSRVDIYYNSGDGIGGAADESSRIINIHYNDGSGGARDGGDGESGNARFDGVMVDNSESGGVGGESGSDRGDIYYNGGVRTGGVGSGKVVGSDSAIYNDKVNKVNKNNEISNVRGEISSDRGVDRGGIVRSGNSDGKAQQHRGNSKLISMDPKLSQHSAVMNEQERQHYLLRLALHQRRPNQPEEDFLGQIQQRRTALTRYINGVGINLVAQYKSSENDRLQKLLHRFHLHYWQRFGVAATLTGFGLATVYLLMPLNFAPLAACAALSLTLQFAARVIEEVAVRLTNWSDPIGALSHFSKDLTLPHMFELLVATALPMVVGVAMLATSAIHLPAVGIGCCLIGLRDIVAQLLVHSFSLRDTALDADVDAARQEVKATWWRAMTAVNLSELVMSGKV